MPTNDLTTRTESLLETFANVTPEPMTPAEVIAAHAWGHKPERFTQKPDMDAVAKIVIEAPDLLRDYQARVAFLETALDKSIGAMHKEAVYLGMIGRLDLAGRMMDQANKVLEFAGLPSVEDDDDPRIAKWLQEGE